MNIPRLLEVFYEARQLVRRPGNDFIWSFWEDFEEADLELKGIISALEAREPVNVTQMGVMFTATGPLQEVAMSSGWSAEFLDLAERFDAAMAAPGCACPVELPNDRTQYVELGMDEIYAEVSTFVCGACGQLWLRYHYENEGFTGSGRWYVGPISASLAQSIKAEDARAQFEKMEKYFYGGSYYDGRVDQRSGPIVIHY